MTLVTVVYLVFYLSLLLHNHPLFILHLTWCQAMSRQRQYSTMEVPQGSTQSPPEQPSSVNFYIKFFLVP